MTQPLATDAVDTIIGYRLRRAQLAVFQRFSERFATLDLRPAEYSALTLIAANPGRKQTEIAEILGIKRANFVSLINGLHARGLTESRRPQTDRRAHALFLTPDGQALLDKATALQTAFEADCVERLGGAANRDRLMELLAKLTS